MRQLLPVPVDDVDVHDAVRPPPGPWLRVGFVESVEGTVVDGDGRSGGLGGEGDHRVFDAIRSHADVILVGAGTARTERYGPHRPDASERARRAADGRPAPAAIALVSGSLDLDPGAPVFAEAVTPTIVVTSASAPADRRRALERAGRVLVSGDDHVDLAGALRRLHADGLASVVCEGGPSLAGALFTDGLADELCVTLAPRLTGSGGKRIVERLGGGVALRLERVLEHGGELLLGYVVDRGER